ncbi:MAG: hypothetical protein AAB803_02905 [Patescibacteria group bacterium]
MSYQSIEKRVLAAQDILQAKEINRATFESLRSLLSGIHPRIDRTLSAAGTSLKHIDQIQKGDAIGLVVESLPEITPEQKKRKKAILLFLKFWNDLKGEVSRIEKELGQAKIAKSHGTTRAMGRIWAGAKGPLGIITLVAAGIVALKATEVSIVIKNVGCRPMTPMGSIAVNIPGLMLPSETIPTGGEAVAKLPPLHVSVDATSPNQVQLKMYGLTYNFSLETSDIRLIFDGKILNGTKTSLNLGSQKQHTLVAKCNN